MFLEECWIKKNHQTYINLYLIMIKTNIFMKILNQLVILHLKVNFKINLGTKGKLFSRFFNDEEFIYLFGGQTGKLIKYLTRRKEGRISGFGGFMGVRY
jgi:hypothetical protein